MHRFPIRESQEGDQDNGPTATLDDTDENTGTYRDSTRQPKFRREKEEVELRADATALFGDENDGGRGVGSGTTVERLDRGLSSTVGNENRDGYGRSLSGSQRHRANRLRQWQRRSYQSSSRDRSLRIGLDEIRRMSTALGAGKGIRRTACQLFRQATDQELLVGRSIEGIASGCVYIGARTFGHPRSFDKVAHVSRVDRAHIVSCYTTLRDEFELELAPVNPQTYVPRIVTDIGATPIIEQTARQIIEQAQSIDGNSKSVIGGTSPTSIAAAAVYAAAVHKDSDLTQTSIADAADVHVSTIRNNYRELLNVYHASR